MTINAVSLVKLTLAVVLANGFFAASAAEKPFGRMDVAKLNIGTYCLAEYARTESHVKDIADCGIDFVVSVPYDQTLLDLFAKYKLGAIVNGVAPGWWGGDGSRAGKMAETCPLELYEKAAKEFKDHPAIWGIDVGDEPSAKDFPHYGKVIDYVNKAFPNQFAYLNLYPNYASVAKNSGKQVRNQLGTPTYNEHIAEYVKNVNTPYICYDFYAYSFGGLKDDMMFANFKTVTDACRATGRKFWYVLQVNSNRAGNSLSENQLRYQAHVALAYGAETLIWACWTKGWWYDNVLDLSGLRTGQYAKLKKVNVELHRLSDTLMKYSTVKTHFVGMRGGAAELTVGGVAALQATDGAGLVVGEMDSRAADGKQALFVVAADDPLDRNPASHLISFKSFGPVKVVGAYGEIATTRAADGAFVFALASNAAAIVLP